MVDGLYPTPCSRLHGDPGWEDTLASGPEFRTANLEDDLTRECTAILVDVCYRGAASL